MKVSPCSGARVVFWDFDGVIKDSVTVKSAAFEKLFLPFGGEIAKQVRRHHEANGGMSRYEKIPVYLRLAGEIPTPERVSELCRQFGELVLQEVIDAPWVPGAVEYLLANPHEQVFILVSATPREELEDILRPLGLRPCFAAVFGAPVSKAEAIRVTLNERKAAPHDCLMVGDALADMEAAEANGVPFLLRKHATNAGVFQHYSGPSVADFLHC